MARLNGLISQPGANLGQGDYQDQRDALVRDLAAAIGVEAQFTAEGHVGLVIGGHFLVQGTTARDLTVDTSTAGVVSVDMATGAGSVDVSELLGGEFGGLLDAHEAADGHAADLDTWVSDFATAFNTQHAAGFDSTGAAGGDFFSSRLAARRSPLMSTPRCGRIPPCSRLLARRRRLQATVEISTCCSTSKTSCFTPAQHARRVKRSRTSTRRWEDIETANLIRASSAGTG